MKIFKIFEQSSPETPIIIYKLNSFIKTTDSFCGISGQVLFTRALEQNCLTGKESAVQVWGDAKNGNKTLLEHIEYLFPSHDRVWIVGILDNHWEIWWRPLDTDFDDRSRKGFRQAQLLQQP